MPAIPALKAAWLEGYQAVRPLSDADIAIIDAMVLLRRMALLAWIGSHGETRLAQTHVDGFAARHRRARRAVPRPLDQRPARLIGRARRLAMAVEMPQTSPATRK